MERHRQLPGLRTSLVTNLAITADDRGWTPVASSGRSYIAPGDLFPTLSFWSYFSWVRDFLEHGGRVAAIVLAIISIVRFLTWLIGVAMRIYAQFTDPEQKGPMGPARLLELVMPSMTAVRVARLARAAMLAKQGVGTALTTARNSPALHRAFGRRAATRRSRRNPLADNHDLGHESEPELERERYENIGNRQLKEPTAPTLGR
jgi:hypothetical protein